MSERTHALAGGPLALGPELTTADAAQLRETLLQALDAGDGDLVLDLAGVSDFGSSGVPLLLAAKPWPGPARPRAAAGRRQPGGAPRPGHLRPG